MLYKAQYDAKLTFIQVQILVVVLLEGVALLFLFLLLGVDHACVDSLLL